MNTNIKSFLFRRLREESAQVLPMMALMMMGFLGMAAIVADVGDVYYKYNELVASTNAAALAAAQGLPSNSASVNQAQNNAGEFSAAPTSLTNAPTAGVNSNGLDITAYSFSMGCLSTGVGATVPCLPTAGTESKTANIVQVQQAAKVRTYFAALFGTPYVTISATSSALMRGTPAPFNIALIVDMTGSMNTTDTNCVINGVTQTRLGCALNGLQTFLANISACGVGGCEGSANNSSNYTNAYDKVALFTFPNGAVKNLGNDYNCSALPADELNPVSGQTITNYKNAVPYVFPAIGSAAPVSYYFAQSNGSGGTQTYTYQVSSEVTNTLGDANGFMSNYAGSNNGLSTASDLVLALGGKSGCSSMQAPYIDGTYYASAIYQAQAALTAEGTAFPASQNVMIILGDGDSNVSSSYVTSYNAAVTTAGQTNGQVPSSSPAASTNYYPALTNDCGQAILAAAYAKSLNTTVYTVSYGASITSDTGSSSQYTGSGKTKALNPNYNPNYGSSGGCSTDTTGIPLKTNGPNNTSTGLTGSSEFITPCQTLQDMASNPATFYSDYQKSDASTSCVGTSTSSFSDLATIFKAIAGNLGTARLVPNSVYPSS
jgi:hypothetical protein